MILQDELPTNHATTTSNQLSDIDQWDESQVNDWLEKENLLM